MSETMITEEDVVLPTLEVLDESLIGELTTTQLRQELRERLPLSAVDMKPLRNRSDQRVDQIIRNLKSHKKATGNPFFEGLLVDVPRGFRITDTGRRFVRSYRSSGS
jgi:hypothetical protein